MRKNLIVEARYLLAIDGENIRHLETANLPRLLQKTTIKAH